MLTFLFVLLASKRKVAKEIDVIIVDAQILVGDGASTSFSGIKTIISFLALQKGKPQAGVLTIQNGS